MAIAVADSVHTRLEGGSHQRQAPSVAFNRITRRGALGSVAERLRLRSGAVPRELSGVLFRNGPGRLSNYGTAYDHLFDGDGMVQRLEFDNGTVSYQSRYVETEAFRQEQEAGRPLYRSFGTNLPGGISANALRFRFKNAANTNLLWTGAELLALWEGGAPYRVDPVTLDCLGPWKTTRELANRTLVERLMANGRPFSAHPKALANSESVYNFGLSPGLVQRLLLYRQSGETLTTTEVRLPRLTFMHDFIAMEDGTRLFFDLGVSFHLGRAFVGAIPPGASVHGDPRAETLVRIFDKADAQTTVNSPSGYVFHLPNGYRDGSSIVADSCWLDRFPDADDFKNVLNDRTPRNSFLPYLTRHTINPERGTHETQKLSPYPTELPAINPQYRGRPYRYIWGVAKDPAREGAMPMHGLVRTDTVRGESQFVDFYPSMVGEPLFVPTSGTAPGPYPVAPGNEAEDDGFLISMAVDPETERGLVIILRADTMETVAVLETPEPVHMGFHGIWLSDEEVRR